MSVVMLMKVVTKLNVVFIREVLVVVEEEEEEEGCVVVV